LDVSELDLQRYKQEDLGFRPQKPKQKNKQLKKKIRKLLSSTDRMSEDEIELIDMWDILPGERWRMYRYWQNVYCENLQDKIRDKEIEFEQTCGKYHEVLMQEDKAIMRNSTVIGLTTTCAARYQSVLQEIGPRIIIVEEAAEVLEGHVITTLSRRCEHLILIGDHKQLKPKPTVYKLARDYKLDLSLFERMANNDVDLQCLALQHRMRPKISKMMRIIYPELKDHDVVKGYDSVRGVSEDVFFIDHMEYESPEKDLRSHSNKHEAEYLVELCRV
jgi:superfamily I DNA and/or RNA helicase